jgi:hypothetical protein
VGKDTGTEEDRVFPFYFIQNKRLPNDPYGLLRMAHRIAVVIHSILNSQFIKSLAEVEKDAHLTSGPMRPPD